jgi:general secretion pathway protein G
MDVTMKRTSLILSRHGRRGFTLTEVLLVLAILGVIAAMVVPNLLAQQKNALARQTKINIAGLESAAKNYAVGHDGEFPRDINSMLNPGQDASGKPVAPSLEKIPKDAWNIPLNYEYPNSKSAGVDKPAIWSSGQNKQNEEGAGDDLNNWSDN